METGSPCLNIILLEVTMRALVCPSPLDLITNSPNRAISSRSTSRIVWREGKEREAGEEEEEERIELGETLIVKLTSLWSLLELCSRFRNLDSLFVLLSFSLDAFCEMRPFLVIIHGGWRHQVVLNIRAELGNRAIKSNECRREEESETEN